MIKQETTNDMLERVAKERDIKWEQVNHAWKQMCLIKFAPGGHPKTIQQEEELVNWLLDQGEI